MNSIKIISLLILFTSLGFSQTFPLGDSYPGDNYSSDNFSSPFGPRNKGNREYPNYIDNDNKYDYDFHGGVDIAAVSTTNVYSMYDGKVLDKKDIGTQTDWIDVYYYEDGEEFVIRYMHMNPNNDLNTDFLVTAGQKIGEVIDYYPIGTTSGDHLDFRYTTLTFLSIIWRDKKLKIWNC